VHDPDFVAEDLDLYLPADQFRGHRVTGTAKARTEQPVHPARTGPAEAGSRARQRRNGARSAPRRPAGTARISECTRAFNSSHALRADSLAAARPAGTARSQSRTP
jgi:hypothetical protein